VASCADDEAEGTGGILKQITRERPPTAATDGASEVGLACVRTGDLASMLLIRHFERRVLELFAAGILNGATHPSLAVLSPEQLKNDLNARTRLFTTATDLGPTLRSAIADHASAGDLVLCLSGGGPGSLDQWLRVEFAS
jgi:hypothetical protein